MWEIPIEKYSKRKNKKALKCSKKNYFSSAGGPSK